MAAEIKKKDQSEVKSLEKMTVKELRALALEIPRSVAVTDMKKDELIALIKQSRGGEDEGDKKKEKKETVKAVRTVKTKGELKTTIRLLKRRRIDAQEKHDKKSADRLRRRISRLKKRTRKAAA